MIDQALADLRPKVRDSVFRVHPANVAAVRLFRGMSTQWNMITVQGLDSVHVIRTGLRYETLDRVARGLGIEEGEGDFGRLQILEAEALAAFAEAAR
jgi:hypothetical protein